MSKAVSRGQALQVAARVAMQVNWDELDGDRLQEEIISLTPQEFGAKFTAFLKNNSKSNDSKLLVRESKIIRIDRTMPFDPPRFILIGQESGGFEPLRIVEQDTRSIILSEIDLGRISLQGCIVDRKGKYCLNGRQQLINLTNQSSRYVRLDAKIFQMFWENKQLIPEYWKELRYGMPTYICFHGTIFSGRNEDRYVLFLYFDDNQWKCWYSLLDNQCLGYHTSAVLVTA
ncbi:MAG: hypothetical protein U1A23_02450 [Candidatus Sungbacteria bacterium]|nr:hypothetical protein [bacterium]MDZ4285762.1 hypothetical protein [Candidatus Sungbacteria bacterium]